MTTGQPESTVMNGNAIGVSAVSLVELVYATEKATNPLTKDDLTAIRTVLDDPRSSESLFTVACCGVDVVSVGVAEDDVIDVARSIAVFSGVSGDP